MEAGGEAEMPFEQGSRVDEILESDHEVKLSAFSDQPSARDDLAESRELTAES